MEKQLLGNIKKAERETVLSDSADKVEMFGYTKPFTPGEILSFKDDLSTTMINLSQMEDELNKVKEEYKQKMKPLIEDRNKFLVNIKNKAEFVNEKCYVMFEDSEAGYYNSLGELVYQRPLLPNEQKTIFTVKREGTND